MSTDELVNAYVDGGVSRRTFIRRLVAGGISLGAAVSYAHLLAPERAGASPATNPDFYTAPQPRLDVASRSSDAIVNKGKIKLIVFCEEPASVQLEAKLPVGGKPTTVASTTVDFAVGGEQVVLLQVRRKVRSALGDLHRARVTVFATATDRQGQATATSAQQTLKSNRN